MDIRFQTGHEPKVRFSKGERSAAEKIVDLLADYGKMMRSEFASKLSVEFASGCCDIGLLSRDPVADDKTP